MGVQSQHDSLLPSIEGLGHNYDIFSKQGGFPGSHLPVREKLSNIGIIIISYSFL